MNKDKLVTKYNITSKLKLRFDNFVNHYLKFGDGKDAYISISPNCKLKSAYDCATKYLRHPYVQEQIMIKNKRINDKMEKNIQMNREKIIQELTDILEKTKSSEDYHLSLKSLDQISKILGVYAPIKTDNKHENIVINYINPSDEEMNNIDYIDYDEESDDDEDKMLE